MVSVELGLLTTATTAGRRLLDMGIILISRTMGVSRALAIISNVYIIKKLYKFLGEKTF